jgi:hypothetical protein
MTAPIAITVIRLQLYRDLRPRSGLPRRRRRRRRRGAIWHGGSADVLGRRFCSVVLAMRAEADWPANSENGTHVQQSLVAQQPVAHRADHHLSPYRSARKSSDLIFSIARNDA